MKKHIINHSTYSMGLGNPSYEVFLLPSKTVPGMTLSLKQLVERYTKGLDVTTFTPTFSDDPDIPIGIEKMDKFEKLEMAANLKAGIEDFRRKTASPKNLPPTPKQEGILIDEPAAS